MTKKELTVLFTIGTLILICYIITGFYSHPSADDFSYATLGLNDNFLLTVLNERQRWNGRYFSNFLMLFSPLNWGGITGYKLMPLLLICLIFFGTAYVFKNILGSKHIVLSLISTVTTLSMMPDITEGIYWYSGAWTYIPGTILFLIGLSLVFKHHKNLKPYHYLILSLIFIIASGFNEIISLLGMLTFSVCLIKKEGRKPEYIFLLVLFLILFIYIFLAPGNLVRESFFPNKNQFGSSIFKSTLYTVRFVGEWLFNPTLFFLVLILLKINFNSDKIVKLNFLKSPLFIFVSLIIPTFICCFGPMWSTGSLSQFRTLNLASYLFFPLFMLTIIANKDFILKKLKLFAKFKYTFLVFIIFFAFWKNHFFLYQELLNGDITRYNHEMYERYKKINNCYTSNCYIQEIKNKPKTLFKTSLDDDPNHWLNKAYQSYFNSGLINKLN